MLSELVKETLFRVCDRTEVSQVVLCIHQPLLEVVQLLLEGLGLFNDNQTLNSTSLTGKHHFKAKQRAPTYPRANCVASERLSRDLCAEETGVWLIETRWEAEKVVIKALSEDNYRYRLT